MEHFKDTHNLVIVTIFICILTKDTNRKEDINVNKFQSENDIKYLIGSASSC